jgi:hypothetical protein
MHILRLVAAAVILSTMPGFALARQSGTSQSSVLHACGAARCAIFPCGKRCIVGCSVNVCFKCHGGWCVPWDRVAGKPIAGGNLNGILKNAPPGAASSNAGNKPVNETPVRATEPVTERVGGKH